MQRALVDVMTKIEDHMMQDEDQDETTNVDEKPSISESIPPHPGPSKATMNPMCPLGVPFKQIWKINYDE